MSDSIALNIDCMEYMRTLPDNAFDLAVVDPPYGDAMDSDSSNRLRFHGGSKNKKDPWNRYLLIDHLPSNYRERERERERNADRRNVGGEVRKKIISWDVAPKQEYFEELFRVSRNQIIWGGNYFPLPPTRCYLIWRKTNIPLEGFSMAPTEYAWTSFNRNAAVFEYTSLRNETSGKFHPTEKPIKLYDWIYSHFANPGDRILDTHLGSGSSRIAAYDDGIDFVGCEIDETYYRLQEERFERHTAQTNLFIQEEFE